MAAAPGLWFEVHPENYMTIGGPRLHNLERIARDFPISLHGVGASLGGPQLPSATHLAQLRGLADRLSVASVSEHAVWSAAGGRYFADLLPLPRTREALDRLCAGVNAMQEALGRTILLENPSNYLSFVSEMDEPGFLTEVAGRTGCGLLLDVNNVYVSAQNCGTSAEDWIKAIPPALVGEIHIAGHSEDPLVPGLLIDSHDQPVTGAVWRLLDEAVAHVGACAVLLERDGNIPAFGELMAERLMAQRVLDVIRAPAQEPAGKTALEAAGVPSRSA